MCATCGCDGGDRHHHHETGERTNRLEVDLLAKNDRLAAENRAWLRRRRIQAVNLMSAPGSGKTALLEATLPALDRPAAVIEGDQETERDAQRIRSAGGRALQLNTGTGCHLDAHMIAHALEDLDPAPGSVLFVENVGNLVCPALFDLGESLRVALVSVTEGEDKPLKYPHMFRAADVVLITKIDLLPHVRFDPAACAANARAVNPRLPVIPLSSFSGEGLPLWLELLRPPAFAELRA